MNPKNCLLIALPLLLISSAVEANQISNTYSFSSTTTEQSIAKTNSIYVDQFDSSLGTLNSVGISISGDIGITMATQVHLVPVVGSTPNNPIMQIVTTDFYSSIQQIFAAQTNELFQFGSASDMLLHGITGAGGIWTWNPSFSYSFSFGNTGLSSLSMQATGVQAYTPPSTVNGSLATFIADPGAALDIYPIQFTDILFANPYDYWSFTSTTTGEMTITYDYTPGTNTGNGTGSTVPTPPALLLMLTALGLLGLTTRFRKAV